VIQVKFGWPLTAGEAIISDRLRQLAAEFMKLSEIGCDTTIQHGFRKLAEAYLKLANASELVSVAKGNMVR
jgi:hypothetical protein